MTYTDYGQWAVSAGEQPNVTLQSETFDNNQINTPELSITSVSGMDGVVEPGNGAFVNNAWADCVGKNGCDGRLYDTTSLNSTKPLYAFGGIWNLQVAYPGGLELYIDGSPQAISPNQYMAGHSLDGEAYSGFFGFVSDSPFYSVLFASSVGSQAFTLDDLVLAIDPPPATTAPEPAALGLLGAGILAVGVFRRKRS